MRYNVEDIENQILATLIGGGEEFVVDISQADVGVLGKTGGLTGVLIKTHYGEITDATFLRPSLDEGFLKMLPFIMVQYQGRRVVVKDAPHQQYTHELRWRLFVGAKSLRLRREGQLTAYAILRAIYDLLHGKVCNSNQPWAETFAQLDGDIISDPQFLEMTPLIEPEGQDEKIMVNLPGIVVYKTDLIMTVLA